jgi:hypothetical protein
LLFLGERGARRTTAAIVELTLEIEKLEVELAGMGL